MERRMIFAGRNQISSPDQPPKKGDNFVVMAAALSTWNYKAARDVHDALEKVRKELAKKFAMHSRKLSASLLLYMKWVLYMATFIAAYLKLLSPPAQFEGGLVIGPSLGRASTQS
jgi:hypothetical protein